MPPPLLVCPPPLLAKMHLSPKMNRNKGQTILSVVMWASGISLTMALTSGTIILNKFEKQNDKIDETISKTNEKNSQQDEAIAENKGDIKAINVKLDLLLQANGISKTMVERELKK